MMQQLAALQAQGKGGLDQLPANVGNYAGGGIIAFPTGGDVPRPAEEDPEERDRRERELEIQRLIARAEADKQDRPQVVSEVPPGGPDLPQGIAGSRRYPKPPEARMEPPAQPPAAPPAASPRPRPEPMGILTPEQASQIKQVQLDRLNLNPYERERMARDEAEKFIGAPDTSSLQALADELAAKRQSIAKRREENQGLREWMRGIAQARPGLTSAQAANAGTEYVRNRESQFETQDFEALKSMLDTKAKISDVKRGWKKDLFTIGKAEFDKVYKDNLEAAQALGKSDMEAKKMAQEAVLEADKQANALKVAGIYTAPQLAANARIERAIASYKKANPKATDYEAQMAVTQPNAYLAPDKQTLAELKTLADNLRAMADPMKNPDPDSQKEAARQLALVTATMAKMGGVDLGGASVPPPGAVRLKQ
jgi:hypothetical protein